MSLFHGPERDQGGLGLGSLFPAPHWQLPFVAFHHTFANQIYTGETEVPIADLAFQWFQRMKMIEKFLVLLELEYIDCVMLRGFG